MEHYNYNVWASFNIVLICINDHVMSQLHRSLNGVGFGDSLSPFFLFFFVVSVILKKIKGLGRRARERERERKGGYGWCPIFKAKTASFPMAVFALSKYPQDAKCFVIQYTIYTFSNQMAFSILVVTYSHKLRIDSWFHLKIN